MIQSFEARGVWSLPGTGGNSIAGTLSFSPQRGLTLALTGTLSEAFADLRSEAYPVIHGVIADSPYGRLVTLIDSFRIKSTLSIPGFTSEEIRAHRAYIGAHLLNEDAAFFRSFRARYTHLAEWSGATGFNRYLVERRDPEIVSVEYRRPPKQTLRLSAGEINIEAAASTHQGGRRVEIKEEVYATGEGLRRKTAPQILDEYVFPFQDFLGFAVDTPCAVEELTLRLDVDNSAEGARQGSVYVLYHPVFWPSDEERNLSPAEIFTSGEALSMQPNLLERWMLLRDTCASFYKTFLGNRYAPPQYLETRFLLTLATLVLFFEAPGRDSETVRDTIDFSRILSPGVIAAERDRRWLNEILPTNAELALPWKLFALIDDYADIFSSVIGGDAGEFVSGVLAIRRQVTTGTGDQEAAGPVLLLRTISVLSLLLNVCVLEYLGFSRDDIRRRLPGTRPYLSLLALKN